MSYVKSKLYRIKPEKKREVLELIEENIKGSKYFTAVNRVLNDKVMCWKRWMYYFDFEILEDILEEVKDEDISEKEKIEDLGI